MNPKLTKDMYEEYPVPSPKKYTPRGPQEVANIVIRIMIWVFFIAFVVHILSLW